MKNITSLSRDTFFYTAAYIVQGLVSFGVSGAVIARFPPAEYGYLSLVNTFVLFFYTIAMLAVPDQGLPRFFIGAATLEDKQSYVTSAAVIVLAGNIIIALAAAGAIKLIPYFFPEITEPWPFIGLVLLIVCATCFVYFTSNILRWNFKAKTFTIIDLFKSSLSFLIPVWGIVFLSWHARQMLLATGLVLLICGMIFSYSVREYLKAAKVSLSRIKELLNYSFPLFWVNLLAFFSFFSASRLFVARFADLRQLAIFSAAGLVASLVSISFNGFLGAFSPYVLATHHQEWAPRKYADCFALFSIGGVFSIILLGFWGGEIILLIRPGADYAGVGRIVPLLMSSVVLYNLGASFAYGPAITKKTHWSLWSFLSAAVLNIVLSWLFIPRWGIWGAALAVNIASLALAVFSQVISNRLYFVPNRWKLSFAVIFLATVFVVFFQGLFFSGGSSPVNMAARLAVTLLLLLLGVLPFRRELGRVDRTVFKGSGLNS